MNDDDELLQQAKTIAFMALDAAMPSATAEEKLKIVTAILIVIDVKLAQFTETLANRVETRMSTTPSLSNGGA